LNVPRSEKVEVRLGGERLRFSNLDKPLYPDGTTKAEVIDYHRRIAPVMIPHLKGRPVTLKRYPDGSDGHFFYQKSCPDHAPGFVETIDVPSRRKGKISYCLLDSLPSLLWAANLASLELHTFLHRGEDTTRPTMVAFDLDPGAPAGLLESAEAALTLREVLEATELASFPKSSGSKGIHVYVPLNTPTDYEETKGFAHAVARLLAQREPKRFTSNMKKEKREGKIFVDWSQNSEHKTTVCAYSLRAKSRPTVSAPLEWSEVEAAVEEGDPDRLVFGPDAVVERVREHGDLFAEVRTLRQTLPRG
jgi:bifunctional non-homologous end joining protein LigD